MNAREMRKRLALLELQSSRQQLQQEARLLMQPVNRARNVADGVISFLSPGGTSGWIGLGAVALGLLTGRRNRILSLVSLSASLLPLLIQYRKKRRDQDTPD